MQHNDNMYICELFPVRWHCKHLDTENPESYILCTFLHTYQNQSAQ